MTNPTREALLDTIRHLADRAIPIVAQRNAAYAGGGDVFGNLNLIETLSSGDIRTETGIVIRMGDKVSRLYSLTARNAPENDESLEDTLVDLLGYSALLLLRHRTRRVPGSKYVRLDDPETPPSPPAPEQKQQLQEVLSDNAVWAGTPTVPKEGLAHSWIYDDGTYRCTRCNQRSLFMESWPTLQTLRDCPGAPA